MFALRRRKATEEEEVFTWCAFGSKFHLPPNALQFPMHWWQECVRRSCMAAALPRGKAALILTISQICALSSPYGVCIKVCVCFFTNWRRV